jgi:hypothetical protein
LELITPSANDNDKLSFTGEQFFRYYFPCDVKGKDIPVTGRGGP